MVNTEFYKNGKIYKIVDNTSDKIYIGSTCKLLCQRLAQHRSSYKQYLNGNYHFVTSFEIIKNADYAIILLEHCENIENKEQLRARERYYIENNNCVNRKVDGRTKKEWREDNKEAILQHRIINRDAILQRRKIKYTCESCNCELSFDHKSRHDKTARHQNNLKVNE